MLLLIIAARSSGSNIDCDDYAAARTAGFGFGSIITKAIQDGHPAGAKTSLTAFRPEGRGRTYEPESGKHVNNLFARNRNSCGCTGDGDSVECIILSLAATTSMAPLSIEQPSISVVHIEQQRYSANIARFIADGKRVVKRARTASTHETLMPAFLARARLTHVSSSPALTSHVAMLVYRYTRMRYT